MINYNLNQRQLEILQKAYSEVWVPENEVRQFGSVVNSIVSNSAGNLVGNLIGGAIGVGIGGLLGLAIGAHVGSNKRKYLVIFLNEERMIDSVTLTAKDGNDAIKKVKKINNGSDFEAFRTPEDIKKSDLYLKKLQIKFAKNK